MADPATQQFIDIKSIEEGVVTLSNGNIRSVLMVSSINFDLKSTIEKEALVAGFQRMLNSLDFTIQVVIHSRPLELTEYFEFLRNQQDVQENELVRIQISEYLEFVQELVTLSNIMSKFFYIVVSYDVAVIKKSGSPLDNIFPSKKERTVKKKEASAKEARAELRLRLEHVIILLSEMGLKALPLQDRQLVELYYGLYNPGITLKQKNLEALIATGDTAKMTE